MGKKRNYLSFNSEDSAGNNFSGNSFGSRRSSQLFSYSATSNDSDLSGLCKKFENKKLKFRGDSQGSQNDSQSLFFRNDGIFSQLQPHGFSNEDETCAETAMQECDSSSSNCAAVRSADFFDSADYKERLKNHFRSFTEPLPPADCNHTADHSSQFRPAGQVSTNATGKSQIQHSTPKKNTISSEEFFDSTDYTENLKEHFSQFTEELTWETYVDKSEDDTSFLEDDLEACNLVTSKNLLKNNIDQKRTNLGKPENTCTQEEALQDESNCAEMSYSFDFGCSLLLAHHSTEADTLSPLSLKMVPEAAKRKLDEDVKDSTNFRKTQSSYILEKFLSSDFNPEDRPIDEENPDNSLAVSGLLMPNFTNNLASNLTDNFALGTQSRSTFGKDNQAENVWFPDFAVASPARLELNTSTITVPESETALSTGSKEKLNEAEKRLRAGMNRITRDKSLIYAFGALQNEVPVQEKKRILKSKICQMFHQILRSAIQKRTPLFVVRNWRNWNNFVFEDGMEIYYQNKEYFSHQNQIRGALYIISRMLEIEPWYFPIVPTSKGLVFGDLQIVVSAEEIIECNCLGGTLIPQDVTKIKEFRAKAYFVLIVEKDAIFKKLLDENFPSKFTRPFIIITGKGFPDVNTRLFVRKLWMHLKIPVFILVDADPHGIDIMLTYRFGSMSLGHVSEELTIPNLRWLGILPTEVTLLDITRQPLQNSDRRRVLTMLERPYVNDCPWLKRELEALLTTNCKAEIEGVIKSQSYLTDFYLPSKFYSQDYW